MSNTHELKIKELTREVEHLRRCAEFANKFQRQVLGLGGPYVERHLGIKYGQTYDCSHALKAFEMELERLNGLLEK